MIADGNDDYYLYIAFLRPSMVPARYTKARVGSHALECDVFCSKMII